ADQARARSPARALRDREPTAQAALVFLGAMARTSRSEGAPELEAALGGGDHGRLPRDVVLCLDAAPRHRGTTPAAGPRRRWCRALRRRRGRRGLGVRARE